MTGTKASQAPVSSSGSQLPLAAADMALLELLAHLKGRDYAFTTVTPRTHTLVNSKPENTWARTLRDIFGWSRPFAADLVEPSLWELMQAADILQPWGDAWRSRIRVSSAGGHLFVHSAYPTDDADSVFFGPDTYRFIGALKNFLERNDSALRRIVDIGCGAGPGAIVAGLSCPQAEVAAVDINASALRWTRVNAVFADVPNVKAQHSNLLDALPGQFDLILSNPPYLVDAAERLYRHGGGEFGIELSVAIAETALERLAPGGTLLLYTGVAMFEGRDPLLERLRQRLERSGCAWGYREIDPDIFAEELLSPPYCAADRIAAVVLTVTRPARPH